MSTDTFSNEPIHPLDLSAHMNEDPPTVTSLTPRTDAEHDKTLTPAYEHIGAEQEAWDLARKLEKELIELQEAVKEADECSTSYEGVGLLYWMDSCLLSSDNPHVITISKVLD